MEQRVLRHAFYQCSSVFISVNQCSSVFISVNQWLKYVVLPQLCSIFATTLTKDSMVER